MSTGRRILICPELFWPHLGGIEVLLARMLPELAARGHQVLVLTSNDSGELPGQGSFEGIDITRLPMRDALRSNDPAWILSTRRQAKEIAANFRPDIVHVHGLGFGNFFQLATIRDGYPHLIVTVHLDLGALSMAEQSMAGQLLSAARHVTAVSESLLTQIVQRNPATAGRAVLIPNGVPAPREMPNAISFEPPHLLCLGRLVPQKGFDVALKAFAIIRENHRAARLTVAGPGDTGELQQLARELGVESSVDFAGPVPPRLVPSMLASASVVMMPSRLEGFGLVALEAAMMARPVVGSAIVGLSDVVLDGVTGLLVPPEDPEACARAVERLLREPALARRLGDEGHRRAVAARSWEACVDRYDHLYRQVPDLPGLAMHRAG